MTTVLEILAGCASLAAAMFLLALALSVLPVWWRRQAVVSHERSFWREWWEQWWVNR